jgi:hypothetical protein
MGKSTISMAILNSYVNLPEGTYHNWLVVWNMFYFSIQLGTIIPTSELIFFRGVETPPTSKM